MQMETQQLQTLLLGNTIADKLFGEGNLSLSLCFQEVFLFLILPVQFPLSAHYRVRNFVVICLSSQTSFGGFCFFSDHVLA